MTRATSVKIFSPHGLRGRDCFWGIYTEQQNSQIEEAYQGAERQVEITVGVRRSSFTKWFRWAAGRWGS